MKRILIVIAVVLMLVIGFVMPAFAVNPHVDISVSAALVAATNSQGSWALGYVEINNVLYFSADNLQDDDYSQVENTGNVPCTVTLQGTKLDDTDGAYDWLLTTAAGNQTYSLKANSEGAPTVYALEVKSAAVYTELVHELDDSVADTYDWSMKFTAPNEFSATDDGTQKDSILTLVITKH